MKNTTATTFSSSIYNKIVSVAISAVYSYAKSKELHLPSDAPEEIAHTAAVKVWASLDKFDQNKSKFTTWVSTIARNATIDYLRSNRIHEPLSYVNADGDEYLRPELDMASTTDPENELIAAETRGRLEQTLSTVSAVDRKVFQMRMDGVPPREIAPKVCLSTNSVSKRISVTRNIVSAALAA